MLQKNNFIRLFDFLFQYSPINLNPVIADSGLKCRNLECDAEQETWSIVFSHAGKLYVNAQVNNCDPVGTI